MKVEKRAQARLSSSNAELESGKFSERLQAAIGDLSVLAFSKRCGISDSLIRKYLSGSLPGTDNLVAMARAAGVPIAWLAAGEGTQDPEPAVTADVGEYAYIPLYDAKVSAGYGAWNEGANVLARLAFTRYSLRRKGLDPNELSALRIAGDSNEPELHDGDTVLVDHRHRSSSLEGYYVILLNDHLYAKRLQLQPDGSMAIISTNRAYQPMMIPKADIPDMVIIGSVVWQGHWLI